MTNFQFAAFWIFTLFIFGLTGYAVFELHASGWWFIVAFVIWDWSKPTEVNKK